MSRRVHEGVHDAFFVLSFLIVSLSFSLSVFARGGSQNVEHCTKGTGRVSDLVSICFSSNLY